MLLCIFIWFLVSKLLFEKLAFVCSFDFQLFNKRFSAELVTFSYTIHYTPWSSHCTLSHHLYVRMVTETIRHIVLFTYLKCGTYLMLNVHAHAFELCEATIILIIEIQQQIKKNPCSIKLTLFNC